MPAFKRPKNWRFKRPKNCRFKIYEIDSKTGLVFVVGTTDYMDRFIDEQDASRDRSSSPTAYHSLIFGADSKKGLQIFILKNCQNTLQYIQPSIQYVSHIESTSVLAVMSKEVVQWGSSISLGFMDRSPN